MENQFYDQQYLKLCSIADKEGRAKMARLSRQKNEYC